MSNPMKRRALSMVGVLALALMPLSGCESGVSEETFDQVTDGMTLDQVEGLLGKGESEDRGGTSISGAGVVGGSSGSGNSKTYSWKSGGKQIIIEFRDNKVISKRKAGF